MFWAGHRDMARNSLVWNILFWVELMGTIDELDVLSEAKGIPRLLTFGLIC